jgi:D-amino peptidase
MNGRLLLCLRSCLGIGMIGLFVTSVLAEPYELSKNDVMDPKAIKSPDVSLFGVKIGDPESKAMDVLVNEKIPGIKVEQEALFIFLVDQRKPTGPMAGVRVQDGKVDMIFINNRFAYKTRGLFRNVLNSESPEDIRKLLGKEDYGDENVMGAVLAYDKQGFVINYLGKDVNIEFSPIQ